MTEPRAFISPNPYGHRCGSTENKAVTDCAGCAYERGVADGFKAGYQGAQMEAAQ